MQKLLQALLGALAWGGALFVIAAGAEVLYREAFPEQISLGNLFSRRGLRTKRFFLGAILGVTLCAIFLAYQTDFLHRGQQAGRMVARRRAVQRSAEYEISRGSSCWSAATCRPSPKSSCSACSPSRFCASCCAGFRRRSCWRASSGASDTPDIPTSRSIFAAWKWESAAWRWA